METSEIGEDTYLTTE